MINQKQQSADRIVLLIAALILLISVCFLAFGYLAAERADNEVDTQKRHMLSRALDGEIDDEIETLGGFAVSDRLYEAARGRDIQALAESCHSSSASAPVSPRSFGVTSVGESPYFYCDFSRAADPLAQNQITEAFGLNTDRGFEDIFTAQSQSGVTFSEFSYERFFGEYNGDVYFVLRALIAPEENGSFSPDNRADVVFVVLDLNKQYGDALQRTLGLEGLHFAAGSQSRINSLELGPDPASGTAIVASWEPSRAFMRQFLTALPYAAAISAMLILALYLGLAQLHALTDELANREARMRVLATHDSMTGLANRAHFNDSVDAAINENEGREYAFGFVDLDYFKTVNDTYGHDAGDALIIETADRMKSVLGSVGTIGRLGGDEFAFFAALDGLPMQFDALMTTLVETITAPFTFRGVRIEPGASIGLALCPHHGEDHGSLSKSADLALYEAKRRGRGQFVYYQDIDANHHNTTASAYP
jgi:diguanylate cyclase (GGDEF)-like protein